MKEYLKDFYRIQLQTKKRLSSDFLGNFKTTFRWNGLEFQEFVAREEGEDVSAVDWLVSKREGKILKRKQEEERQIDVLFLLDGWETMQFWKKKDMLFRILFMLALSALENGDKIGSLFFGKDFLSFTPFFSQKWKFFRNYRDYDFYLWGNEENNKKWEKTLSEALSFLLDMKIKKKFIFILSDSFLFDEKRFRFLAQENEVIFLHIFDARENTLEFDTPWIFNLWNKNTWSLFINLFDEKKKEEYKALRKKKIKDFREKIYSLWWYYLMLDDTKNIFKEFFLFMKGKG